MYNIIVFAHLFKPHLGGMEKYIETFYTNIPKKKILIITSRYQQSLKQQEKFKNLHILRIDSVKIINDKYYIPSFRGLRKIIQIFRENYNNNPEIHTHTRFYFINVIASYSSKKYGLKHYHFEHGSSFVRDGSYLIRLFAKIFDYTLAKYTLKNSQLIFPISESVRDFLNKNYKNIKLGPTIYNSLDFKNRGFKSKIKPKIPKLLFVGRLVKSKGIYELLGACKIMKVKNFPFSLTIIGDGSERESIEEYVEINNLSNNVFIKGALPFKETQEEYLKHELFVSPSYTEGLPTTILEALSNSLLIVATDAGGTREIIPIKNLIPLDKLTPQILAKRIIKTFNQWDEETILYEKLFQKAKEKFSTGNVIKVYLKISENG